MTPTTNAPDVGMLISRLTFNADVMDHGGMQLAVAATMREAAAHLSRLEDHLAQARADGERYRWLRWYLSIEDIGDEDFVYGVTVRTDDIEDALQKAKCWPTRPLLTESSIDAAIDAAINRTTP